MKINAVIVTYNRKDLLILALSKLCCQTFPLNKIIIVDNNSTDGTKEWLKVQDNPLYKIIFLEKNLGGAGGFYHGIKNAYEIECDYIWVMDDDTITTETALEKLIEGLSVLKEKKVGFVSSNVLYTDDKPCLMNISDTHHEWNEFINKKIIRLTHSSFVSMLIPAAVVKDVGLPIKEYFIWGDDVEYSTRIAMKYEGYFCGDSTVYHYMKENKGIDIITSPKDRIARYFYFYRNCMTTNRMRGFSSSLRFLLSAIFCELRILLSKNKNKFYKIWIIAKGIFAGLFFRVKIDYVGKKEND